MAPPGNRRPGFSRRAQYGLFLTYVGAISGALIGGVLLLLSAFNPTALRTRLLGTISLTNVCLAGLSTTVARPSPSAISRRVALGPSWTPAPTSAKALACSRSSTR